MGTISADMSLTADERKLEDVVAELALLYQGKCGLFRTQDAAREAVRWLYADLHNEWSTNYYRHRTRTQCLAELVRRCELLTLSQARLLLKIVTNTWPQRSAFARHVLDI